MFGTFRKHQTWLWAIIITVIVISFVLYFSPDTKFKFRIFGNKPLLVEMNGHPVTIGGEPIPQDEEYQNIRKETLLSHFMRNGAWPGNEVTEQEDFKRYVIMRLFLLRKLTEMEVHVSEKAVAAVAHDRIGNYPPASFEKDLLQPHGLMLEDFERYCRHETALQQLVICPEHGALSLAGAGAGRLRRVCGDQLFGRGRRAARETHQLDGEH